MKEKPITQERMKKKMGRWRRAVLRHSTEAKDKDEKS